MPNKRDAAAMASHKYPESLLLRLEAGTTARIDDALERFEGRSHMVREAIEREIRRRGKSRAEKQQDPSEVIKKELDRFLAYARSIGIDPTYEEFEGALKRLVSPKRRAPKTRR